MFYCIGCSHLKANFIRDHRDCDANDKRVFCQSTCIFENDVKILHLTHILKVEDPESVDYIVSKYNFTDQKLSKVALEMSSRFTAFRPGEKEMTNYWNINWWAEYTPQHGKLEDFVSTFAFSLHVRDDVYLSDVGHIIEDVVKYDYSVEHFSFWEKYRYRFIAFFVMFLIFDADSIMSCWLIHNFMESELIKLISIT